MRCPSCTDDLSPTRPPGLGIEIDICGNCGAGWFDRSELDIYIREHPHGISLAGKVDPKSFTRDNLPSQCPRCLTLSMDTAKSDTFILGRCVVCEGAFLGPRDPSREELRLKLRAQRFEDTVEGVFYLFAPELIIIELIAWVFGKAEKKILGDKPRR